jgi:hypothetical protein
LQNELSFAIKPLFTQGDEAISHIALSQIPLLDAIINEAMRLHGSVTTGGARATPKEGVQIGEIYLPGNVNMFLPPHALHLGEFLIVASPARVWKGNMNGAHNMQMSDTLNGPRSSCQRDGLLPLNS